MESVSCDLPAHSIVCTGHFVLLHVFLGRQVGLQLLVRPPLVPLQQVPCVALPGAEGALVEADAGVDAHVVLERLLGDEGLAALGAVEDGEAAIGDGLVQLPLDVQVHPALADAAEAGLPALLALVLLREVDEGQVPPPRAVVSEQLVALGALHLHRLLLVHHLDVVVPGVKFICRGVIVTYVQGGLSAETVELG